MRTAGLGQPAALVLAVARFPACMFTAVILPRDALIAFLVAL